MIEVINKTRAKIDLGAIRRLAEKFLRAYGAESKELSIAFIGEKEMRRLNAAYRRKDSVTDVLAFGGEEDFLGEIIICHQQIARQGRIYGTGTEEELKLILVHGLLHLTGHTDESEAKRRKMMELAGKFLEKNND